VQEVSEFAARLEASLLGAIEVFTVYIGDRLGFYRLLSERSFTVSELAASVGIHERHAREWLEQQTVAGLVDVDDPGLEPEHRRYRLGSAQAELLANPDSVTFFPPSTRAVAAIGARLRDLLHAYRTGGGVEWSRYGPDLSEGQEAGHRPGYLSSLAVWIAAGLPDVDERLKSGGKVADVGCGAGWSSIAFAIAYPEITVDGFDLDIPAIERAEDSADRLGLTERVRFHAVDPSDVDHQVHFELVCAFDCIHDMPDPVGVLSAMRSMAGDDGAVLVADVKTKDGFEAPGDERDRLLYAYSVLLCLPASMATPGSAATGTVMRPSTLAEYARAAGFSRVEILPVEHDTWSFYRLVR